MAAPTVASAIERAFDYRGFVTLTRRDGTQLVGFVYDRDDGHVELFDDTGTRRIRVAVADIAEVALTGEDSAATAQRIWERRRGALEPSSAGDRDEPRPVLFAVALPFELRAV